MYYPDDLDDFEDISYIDIIVPSIGDIITVRECKDADIPCKRGRRIQAHQRQG